MSRFGKKKWIMIIIVLALGIEWRIYTDFNGSMIGKIRSKHIVEEYLNAKYSEDKFTVGNISYNFKFKSYVVDVLTKTEEKQFKVIIKNRLKFLEDSRLSDSLSSEFLNSIRNIVKETVSSVEKVSGHVYPLIIVQKDFQNGILRKDTFWIDLYNEKGVITKEEFADISNNILNWIKQQDFMVSNVYFNFHTKESKIAYNFDINKEDLYLSRDELLELIKE